MVVANFFACFCYCLKPGFQKRCPDQGLPDRGSLTGIARTVCIQNILKLMLSARAHELSTFSLVPYNYIIRAALFTSYFTAIHVWLILLVFDTFLKGWSITF